MKGAIYFDSEKNYFFRQAQQIFACIVLSFHLNIEVYSSLVWPPSPLLTTSILYNSYVFNSTSNYIFFFLYDFKIAFLYLSLAFISPIRFGWLVSWWLFIIRQSTCHDDMRITLIFVTFTRIKETFLPRHQFVPFVSYKASERIYFVFFF